MRFVNSVRDFTLKCYNKSCGTSGRSAIWKQTDERVVLSFLFHRWSVSGSDAGLPLPCASDSVVLVLVCRQTNMLACGFCGACWARRGAVVIHSVVLTWRWRCVLVLCACWSRVEPAICWSGTSFGKQLYGTKKPLDRLVYLPTYYHANRSIH